MKNSSRKNAQKRNGSGSNKKGSNGKAAKQAQVDNQNQAVVQDAETEAREAAAAKQAALNKKAAKAKAHSSNQKKGSNKNANAESAGDIPAESPVLYEVKTKRDSSVLLAYITFTYRAFHPAVTTRMVFYGLLVLVPGFFIKIQAVKIACWVIGALIILLGLFRQYISLALTKNNDPEYRSGAEFTYEFKQNEASVYRNGELIKYLGKYKDIDAMYHDEDYYYMRLKDHDFYILPKKRFTTGDAASFENFIYSTCRKTCRFVPAKLSNKIKKRRAVRQMNSK